VEVMALYQSLCDEFANSILPEVATAPSIRIKKDGGVHSQKMQVEHKRTTAKPARPHPSPPRPPQDSGNWLDTATAFFSEGSRTIVHNAEALWKAPQREMTAASILDVIASMDTPFDTPDFVTLPAAAPLREDISWACAPAVEQQGFTCLRANFATDAHLCWRAGPNDGQSMDCAAYTTAHASWGRSDSAPTWSSFRGTMLPVHPERAESAPTGWGRKRAHPSAFDAVVSKKLHEAGGTWREPEREVSDPAGAAWDHNDQTRDTAPPARATPFSEPASPGGGGGESFGSREQLRWKLSQRLARSKAATAAAGTFGSEPGATGVPRSQETAPSLGPP
jgi:hypothetical protein